jgi:acyl-CoA synthetase (AMP-forming)/AMP-acid ligase II
MTAAPLPLRAQLPLQGGGLNDDRHGHRPAAALAAAGPGAGLGPADRVALCLTDPGGLVAALAALDGGVAALLLLSHALPMADALALAQAAGATALLTDRPDLAEAAAAAGLATPGPAAATGGPAPAGTVPTAWLLTTSGTTGLPKIVPHTLASLARTVSRIGAERQPRWGLLYDPTRFAGLQVVLQALIGGGLLVAPDTAHTGLADQVAALARHGVTHLSATPTLWRRLLMVPGIAALPLAQATLGGETVDQDILDTLARAFPAARRTHIYASTEAGVGFSVNDGRAGFPSAWLERPPGGVRLALRDGILWLCPPGPARAPGPGIEVDAEGFVRSGDLIRLDGDRALFLGRENGLINVGGVKVYPETVERCIGAVPGVRLVRVSAKKSPITGALVLAEVMAGPDEDPAALKARILAACRTALPREAVPGAVRLVGDMTVNAAGKLVRRGDSGEGG